MDALHDVGIAKPLLHLSRSPGLVARRQGCHGQASAGSSGGFVGLGVCAVMGASEFPHGVGSRMWDGRNGRVLVGEVDLLIVAPVVSGQFVVCNDQTGLVRG